MCLCVCVKRLNKRKISPPLHYYYIYIITAGDHRGPGGAPGGSVINEDTSPGHVYTYLLGFGGAPGRI